MSRAQIERRLRDNVRRLDAARADLAVTAEQLVTLTDETEDLRIRALVADDRRIASEHRAADRNLAAMRRHHDDLAEEISRLEVAQDDLLDRLQAGG